MEVELTHDISSQVNPSDKRGSVPCDDRIFILLKQLQSQHYIARQVRIYTTSRVIGFKGMTEGLNSSDRSICVTNTYLVIKVDFVVIDLSV